MELTAERLRQVVDYDPATGIFVWRFGTRASRPAGSVSKNGYVKIGIDGRRGYYAHRLAFLWMGIPLPDGVDHRNGRKADNAWENLRAATQALNNQNQRAPKRNSTTGVLGVHRNGSGFEARIGVGAGVRLYLGTFRSKEAAGQAYLKAKRKLHAGCTI